MSLSYLSGIAKLACTILVAMIVQHRVVAAETLVIEFVTDIRDVSSVTFQVGEKSRQTVTLDLDNNSATQTATTGVTTVIPGWSWESIRDNFQMLSVSFGNPRVKLSVKGQTASAVGIMPDIDYRFDIIVNRQQRKVWISGCHNEFPSYRVLLNGAEMYDRVQTGNAFTGLLGVCDIVLAEEKSY